MGAQAHLAGRGVAVLKLLGRKQLFRMQRAALWRSHLKGVVGRTGGHGGWGAEAAVGIAPDTALAWQSPALACLQVQRESPCTPMPRLTRSLQGPAPSPPCAPPLAARVTPDPTCHVHTRPTMSLEGLLDVHC